MGVFGQTDGRTDSAIPSVERVGKSEGLCLNFCEQLFLAITLSLGILLPQADVLVSYDFQHVSIYASHFYPCAILVLINQSSNTGKCTSITMQ